jgi:hypothetical protein
VGLYCPLEVNRCDWWVYTAPLRLTDVIGGSILPTEGKHIVLV